jgi:SAM-dependent methyltransferase
MVSLKLDYAKYLWQLVNGFRSNHERAIAKLREDDLSLQQLDKSTLRILDLANGSLRPQYYILRASGYSVYGIDVVNCRRRTWQARAYIIARWLYTRNISARSCKFDDTLVCGDVSALPFQDESVDIVTSVAAFEHFLDVPQVVRELYRITKRGAVVWVLIHLFTSPSGGHNVSLTQIPLRYLPHKVDPWDHLRKQYLPFNVPLNKWRQDQYLIEFQKYFEVLKQYCAMREGEHFLTVEIENELSNYTRDELTCGAYVIVARKS